MVIIDQSKNSVVNNKDSIVGDLNRVIILSSEDLNNIDFILCGQSFDIAIVPRPISEIEADRILCCMFDSPIKRIIVNK